MHLFLRLRHRHRHTKSQSSTLLLDNTHVFFLPLLLIIVQQELCKSRALVLSNNFRDFRPSFLGLMCFGGTSWWWKGVVEDSCLLHAWQESREIQERHTLKWSSKEMSPLSCFLQLDPASYLLPTTLIPDYKSIKGLIN